MKKHTINARISEKTTAELYFYLHMGIYTGLFVSSSLYFYGTRSGELNKALKKFMEEEESLRKEEFEQEKKNQINELEKQLLVTVDGWFKKPSKSIKKELKEKREQNWRGIGAWKEHELYCKFLSNYNAVKISTNDNHTIYEILP